MDRCRCDDYAAAVKSIKFFTMGTYRPEAIENFDRSGYAVGWVKNGVSYADFRFSKPKSRKVSGNEITPNALSPESRRVEKMWCPFMTPIDR